MMASPAKRPSYLQVTLHYLLVIGAVVFFLIYFAFSERLVLLQIIGWINAILSCGLAGTYLYRSFHSLPVDEIT